VKVAILPTPRLRLRPWCEDDLDAWLALHADARVTEWLGGSGDRAEVLARFILVRKRFDERGYGWWALEVQGGPVVGAIGLQPTPFDASFTPVHEVGWRLAHEAWGHGYATEGARAALDFGFDVLGLDEIVAFTAKTNERSQRVMERLGMTRDPAHDFDNPRLPEDHPLRPHVLYRLRAPSRASNDAV
jgi:RimJ/RimL family protein N-acetyltransferase